MIRNGDQTRVQPTVDLQRGLQQFMMLLAGNGFFFYAGLRAIDLEVTSRRKMWDFLPWDPVAWLIIHAEHQEYLK